MGCSIFALPLDMTWRWGHDGPVGMFERTEKMTTDDQKRIAAIDESLGGGRIHCDEDGNIGIGTAAHGNLFKLQAAEQAVIEAAQWVRTVRQEGKMGSAPAEDALDQRLQELDALKSPLPIREKMTTDEEIRTAERALIETMRVMGNCGPEGGILMLARRMAAGASTSHGDAAKVALARLDALLSPLPSRDLMGIRHREGWIRNGGEASAAIAEWHWVDCLRWVAKHPGENFTARADELEARK